MNTVVAGVRSCNPRPLLLLRDLRYPSTMIRSLYQGELQTTQDLYLASLNAQESPNHKTSRYSVQVTFASDGTSISYDRLICKMRLRKDGTLHHRITVPGIGGCETLSEAIQMVLTHAAARREGQVAM